MRHDAQLLEALKHGLQGLNDLRLVPHNDPHVLRLKQHLRNEISRLEQQECCDRAAA
jgi:hypothetical protein